MRRLFIVILSLQILSSGQFLNEVVKFKNLVEHFRQHRQNGSVIDFAEFIQLHYFDPNHKSTDQKNHDSLPLHQASICMNVFFQSPIDEMSISYPDIISDNSYFLEYSDFLLQNTCSSIFQPPKYFA